MPEAAAQGSPVDIPKRLPLVLSPENRDDDSSKDAKLVNGYIEKSQGNEYNLYKRPGLLVNQTKSGAGQGCFRWQGNLYTIFGTDLFKNGVSVGTVDTTNGVYKFTSCLGGTPRLVLGNGVRAYTYDNTTFAQITDGDFPVAFVKGWAYLDGTTYVMDREANIFGSDINDPSSWDPGNVLTAQIEPDPGVALAKQLVYVIALKGWSWEVFYDAQNDTGTPLGRVEGAKGNYGCLSADSIQDIDGALFWAATNKSSAVCIYRLEGLKGNSVSTKPVERLLEQGDFTTGVYSWQIKHRGHAMYCLTLVNLNITVIYDIKEQMWYQWSDTDDNYMPIVDSVDGTLQSRLVQGATDGKLYTMSDDYLTDNGSLFTVDMVTPIFDGGVRSRRKTLWMMRFVADQDQGSILQVRNNDSDYQAGKWTNFRTVDLGQRLPTLSNCGTFYKRAYNFKHRCNKRLRIQGVELQLDIGTL